jgi:hypothetical protein
MRFHKVICILLFVLFHSCNDISQSNTDYLSVNSFYDTHFIAPDALDLLMNQVVSIHFNKGFSNDEVIILVDGRYYNHDLITTDEVTSSAKTFIINREHIVKSITIKINRYNLINIDKFRIYNHVNVDIDKFKKNATLFYSNIRPVHL